MDLSALHERLHAVAGNLTYRALAEATGHHPETVRRYMQGQSPSAEFLASMCGVFDLNAQWLIMGRGPIKRSEARAHALREANPAELLNAIAEALEKLAERVDRLEVFVQSLESRVRAPKAQAGDEETDGQSARIEPGPESRTDSRADSGGDAAADRSARASRIARAVAKRPRPDAD